MVQPMSRAQRRAVFIEKAVEMFDVLEEWYDQHPEASFGELEAEARRLRRKRMGEVLALLINGRGRGLQVEAPRCERCQQRMKFQGYRKWTVCGLERDTRLERAYYICPKCKGTTLFPPSGRSVSGRGGGRDFG